MRLSTMFNSHREKTKEEYDADVAARAPGLDISYVATWVSDNTGVFCQKCQKKFPKSPAGGIKVMQAELSPAAAALAARGELRQKRVVKSPERLEWEKMLIDHACEEHGFKYCEKCGDFVRNLKQHQKSLTCQEQERTRSYEEAGWLPVETPYKVFLEYIELAKKKEMNTLAWEDREKWKDIEKAYHQFKLDLLEKAHIELAPTGRSTGKDFQNEQIGWIWQAWAPELTALCFNHMYARHTNAINKRLNNFDIVAELRQWLDLSEAERECALGGWELATDEVK